MSKKFEVMVAGGHAATTTLATIIELQKHDEIRISWVGSKYAIEGSHAFSLEYTLSRKLNNIKFYPIYAGRLQKKFTKHTVRSILKVPMGFVHAFGIIITEKPDVVLSFGGFAGFPIVFWAWIFQVPILIHEQTAAIGRANKISSYIARQIAISRKSTINYINPRKAVLTGNPILPNILKIKPRKSMSRRRVVYITGGSRGSRWINDAVGEILPELLKSYTVYHQVGSLDIKQFEERRKKLSKEFRAKYEVFESVSPFEVHKMYEKADIVISRAGANSIAEIILTQRPAIVVPIPWSSFDEQAMNAAMAQEIGICRVVHQGELDGKRLLIEIETVARNWKKMVKNCAKNSGDFVDREAAVNLAELLWKIIEEESES